MRWIVYHKNACISGRFPNARGEMRWFGTKCTTQPPKGGRNNWQKLQGKDINLTFAVSRFTDEAESLQLFGETSIQVS